MQRWRAAVIAALGVVVMNVKDLPRYSSSLGRTLTHISFKVKYCHKVFLDAGIRRRCEEVFWNTARDYGFDMQELGFDDDHCHLKADLGFDWSVRRVVKALKGRSGKAILKEFPWLREKLFRKNRFWSPAYYFDSIGKDETKMTNYIRNQKLTKLDKQQTTLANYSLNAVGL